MAGFVGNAQVPARATVPAFAGAPTEIAIPQNTVRIVITALGEDIHWTRSTTPANALVAIAALATSGLIESGSIGELEVDGWFNQGASFFFRAAAGVGGGVFSHYLVEG